MKFRVRIVEPCFGTTVAKLLDSCCLVLPRYQHQQLYSGIPLCLRCRLIDCTRERGGPCMGTSASLNCNEPTYTDACRTRALRPCLTLSFHRRLFSALQCAQEIFLNISLIHRRFSCQLRQVIDNMITDTLVVDGFIFIGTETYCVL